ncbi:MAG: hydrogenase maturation protease [Gammaproteobacteria bacterium]|nr:hydrogenase maturation protease [Gammaproteobacteria bacterium]
MITIIGIGSPVSGDEHGLHAIELLAATATVTTDKPAPHWLALERPGLHLLEAWQGAATVVLIDTLLSPDATEPVQRIELDALLQQTTGVSSHDIGVAEALAMARILGQLPPRLLLYGIAVVDGQSTNAENWLQPLQQMLQEDLHGAVTFRSP